jgi:transposase
MNYIYSMERRDARKLHSETQHELRSRCIRMLRKGMKQHETAEALDVARGTVGRWWGIYQREGVDGLKPRKRGRRYGHKRRLDREQERSIQHMLVDKMPDQLKLPFALWTRKAVQEAIAQHYGVKLPIRTVGEYLHRWGFTPQKPVKRAYEQQPERVKKWLDEEYPGIARHARKEGACAESQDRRRTRQQHDCRCRNTSGRSNSVGRGNCCRASSAQKHSNRCAGVGDTVLASVLCIHPGKNRDLQTGRRRSSSSNDDCFAKRCKSNL